jgi:hypothetical protein
VAGRARRGAVLRDRPSGPRARGSGEGHERRPRARGALVACRRRVARSSRCPGRRRGLERGGALPPRRLRLVGRHPRRPARRGRVRARPSGYIGRGGGGLPSGEPTLHSGAGRGRDAGARGRRSRGRPRVRPPGAGGRELCGAGVVVAFHALRRAAARGMARLPSRCEAGTAQPARRLRPPRGAGAARRDPLADPLSFYDTSSYGPRAVRATATAVGIGQLVHGTDFPVAEPGPDPVAEAFGPGFAELVRGDAASRALGYGWVPA